MGGSRTPLIALVLSATACGSFLRTPDECTLRCSVEGACPSGTACAADGYCHEEGQTDDCRPPDPGSSPDASGGVDGGGGADAPLGPACSPEGATCDDGIVCTADDRCAAGYCTGTVCGCHGDPCCGGTCQGGLTCVDGLCKQCTTVQPLASGGADFSICRLQSISTAAGAIQFITPVYDGSSGCTLPPQVIGSVPVTGATVAGGADFSICSLLRVEASGDQIRFITRGYDGSSGCFNSDVVAGTVTVGTTVSGGADFTICSLLRVEASADQIRFITRGYDGSSGCFNPEVVAGTVSFGSYTTCE